MYASITSGAFHGMESFLVDVEVDVSTGLPCIDMIGYLASEVKETKERVRVGIKNSGYEIPMKRITVNLSPADKRKDGSGFDLPVAIGILWAMEHGEKENKNNRSYEKNRNNATNNNEQNEFNKNTESEIPEINIVCNENEIEDEKNIKNKDNNCSITYDIEKNIVSEGDDKNREERKYFENEKNDKGKAIMNDKSVIIVGEIGLDGIVKPIRGILPILLKAAKEKITTCIIPFENRLEACNVKQMDIFPVHTLKEAYVVYENIITHEIQNRGIEDMDIDWKNNNQKIVKNEKMPPCEIQSKYIVINNNDCNLDSSNISFECVYENANDCENDENKITPLINELDFSQVYGQESAKRAALIAAAGFHNLLLFGSPGSGKSMIAQRMPTILPKMTYEECLEVTQIYSVAGLLDHNMSLIQKRPFVDPHHTVTAAALVGGGAVPRPGLVTLAHKGVLFLDEMPEFGRSKLDLLRQPLEQKKVVISKNKYSCSYDCDFMMIAAMNPCPCGFFPQKNCHCKPWEIDRYLKNISGPLLDRIDLSAWVGKMNWSQIEESRNNTYSNYTSEKMREQVEQAREIQILRCGKFNANLTNEEIKQYCTMTDDSNYMLKKIYEKYNLSMRSLSRIEKVARTIADLEGCEFITEVHVSEAVMLNKGIERLRMPENVK